LSGSNIETESILPSAWGHSSADLVYLQNVHRKYGSRPLRAYPQYGTFERYIWHPHVVGIKTVKVLNYINYNKAHAKATIVEKLGWRDYGGKHYESVFTRFFQGYYLPKKFGFDKRRAHLSSLINAGQITREEALEAMAEPTYDAELQAMDRKFIAKKLGIAEADLEAMIAQPPAPSDAIPSGMKMIQMGVRAKRFLRL
jgi:hypothetical protein